MDLLFKRYASPFLLLDNYILSGMFYEFIIDFMDRQNEDLIWDVWIHKIFDKTFDDFRESLLLTAVNSVAPTKKQLETTVKTSQQILDSFVPKE